MEKCDVVLMVDLDGYGWGWDGLAARVGGAREVLVTVVEGLRMWCVVCQWEERKMGLFLFAF